MTIFSLSRAAERLSVPWNALDFAAANAANSAKENGGAFALLGAGTIGGRADAFHFVYQAVSGDFTATVRVGKLRDAALAGIMLRDALATTSNFVAVGGASSGEIASRFRNLTAPRVGSIAAKNGSEYSWLKIVRRGATARCFFAPDENGAAPRAWKKIGTRQTIASGLIYLGFFVVGAAPENVASAAFDDFSLQPNAAIAFEEGSYTLAPFNAPDLRLNAPRESGGVVTIQNADDNAPPQQWIFTRAADGFYAIHPAANAALSLAVEGEKTENKTPVIVEENRDIATQRWEMRANSNGTYSLMAQSAPGSGLDNFGGATGAGATQDIWQYDGFDPHLQWQLDFAD